MGNKVVVKGSKSKDLTAHGLRRMFPHTLQLDSCLDITLLKSVTKMTDQGREIRMRDAVQ